MKTRIKNLLLLLLLLGLPGVVQAQDAYSTNADGSIYTYSTNADGSANIVAYAGPPWVVTIPTNINGLTVTSIGTNAFISNFSLTSVTIPASVTIIGAYAFSDCTSLTSVTIPNSVTSIGTYAFAYCGLTSVTIPNGVTSIGIYAFEDCYSLTNATIGNSVTIIGAYAFSDCTSLTSITIPNDLTTCAGAFAGSSLTNVTFASGTTSIVPSEFSGCTDLTSITIPNSVTNIGNDAFEGCTSLTSVTIPGSVTSMGNGVFLDCTSLMSVAIPNSVTNFGDYAFGECYNLTNVTIPNSVTNIGVQAFAYCFSLTSVTIPNSVTSIGRQAFEFSFLTSVTIPDSVTSIGAEAFYESDLTNVTIGNSVTSIGGAAFFQCISLTSVHFTGNAPSPTNDSSVFEYEPATVYYLPGTTGWGAMFDGRPTAPWFLPNPLILTHSAGFGVQPGGFGFTISWATNVSVVVQAASNLANPVWIPVSTSPLTAGTNYFSDPQWTNYPERFYRVASAFTVGGTLTGLPAGDTVTLQDNGSDNLTLSNIGPFTFPTALPDGHAYSVTVSGTSGATPPNITLMNGSGTISGANVTNVAVQCTRCPAFTGNMDVDMYNAAVSDGTANGGVPAVMATTFGGPFRVTARGFCSDGVAEAYSTQCKVVTIVGTTSCSSTTLPTGTVVIQFGGALVCGGGPYEY